jgi:hypothetical protein
MPVSRPVEVLRGADTAVRQGVLAIFHQSERNLLLSSILLLSVVSATTVYITQHYPIDVESSLIHPKTPSDYGWSIGQGMRPNPWEPHPQLDQNDYLAAGLVPALFFASLAGWLHAPRLGYLAYLLVLTIAVLSPAVWAARGARGLARVVVFVACGAAAVPAWTVIYRANSVGFVAPIGLAFLVALCRRRWGTVAVMVVLAALVKPQFAVLAVVLFAVRQWRSGGIAVAAVVISNLAAYLLWPRDFPQTIVRSIHYALNHHGTFNTSVDQLWNVSFAKGLLLIPDGIAALNAGFHGPTRLKDGYLIVNAGGTVPEGFMAGPRSLIGWVVLVVVVVCVLALGRRIPPVMAGIALLATASLFPALSFHYYLVFALPIAALVARDPDGPPGSGIFDQLSARGDRRRAVGVCVTLAAALSIARIALPVPLLPNAGPLIAAMDQCSHEPLHCSTFVPTTAWLAPVLWFIACAVIIVSYARKPAPQESAQESARPDWSAA